MKHLVLIILLFAASLIHAQEFKRCLQWKSNYKGVVDFSKGSPPQIGLPDLHNLHYFTMSSSFISDTNGLYLLGSNSIMVFDSTNNIIQDGDSLIDNKFRDFYKWDRPYPQESLLLPRNDSTCYLFNSSVSDSLFLHSAWGDTNANPYYSPHDNFYAHIVNFKTKKVDVRKKSLYQSKSKFSYNMGNITACRHANGKDWWLVKNAYDTLMYTVFLVKEDTILGPYFYGFPSEEKYFVRGGTQFNEQGTEISSVGTITHNFYRMDFDRSTGNISNMKVREIPLSISPTWTDTVNHFIVYSPSGQYLYLIRSFHIFQIDLYDSTSNAFYHVNDGFMQYNNEIYSGLLGPDCKIYIHPLAGGAERMSYISNPDGKGSACGYCFRCLDFNAAAGGQLNYGTVPNMPNYRLGKLGEPLHPCVGPVAIPDLVLTPQIEVFPNPAKQLIYIQLSSISKVQQAQLIDISGRIIHQQAIDGTFFQIDCSTFTKGLYVLRIGNVSKRVVVE
jgi:hypothetical protein